MELLFDNFDQLTDAPNGVQKLRELILQLAVMGKVVPQNPDDEPSSELLMRIQAEKKKLIREGKIKKEKPLPPISKDEIPYELPKGWEWAKLRNLSKNIHYGYTASADSLIKDMRILRITDIQSSKVNWETVPGCIIDEKEIPKFVLNKNDILIARTGGTIGKSYLVNEMPFKAVFASYLIRFIPTDIINSLYIKLFLETPLYWDQLIKKSMGTGQPNVNGVSLSNLLIPLPPIEEQKRIVAKVDQLMALCDQLEKQKEQRDKKRINLNHAALNKLLTSREPSAFQKHWQRIVDHFDLLYDVPENVAELKKAILQLAVMGKLVPQNSEDEPASELLKRIQAEKKKLIHEGKIKKEKPLPPVKEDEISFELPKGWEWSRLNDITTKITDGEHIKS